MITMTVLLQSDCSIILAVIISVDIQAKEHHDLLLQSACIHKEDNNSIICGLNIRYKYLMPFGIQMAVSYVAALNYCYIGSPTIHTHARTHAHTHTQHTHTHNTHTHTQHTHTHTHTHKHIH